MAGFAGGITVPVAIARAIALWKKKSFPQFMKRIEYRMTRSGDRTLQRRTGNALDNVKRNSRTTPMGMVFATTTPYLIAWMEGSSRKAYWVAPKRAKFLSWIDKRTGLRRFSKGHMIPAWEFKPKRPVIEDGVRAHFNTSEKILAKEMTEAMGTLFPDITERVRLRLGG